MLHLQVTCEIQNQRQEVNCAHLDHTRSFQLRGCARSKPQFLTAVQSLRFAHGWIPSPSSLGLCLGNTIQYYDVVQLAQTPSFVFSFK